MDKWPHHMEHYFVVNRLTKRDKLDVAILCLEGKRWIGTSGRRIK